jgi:hypothetical protein
MSQATGHDSSVFLQEVVSENSAQARQIISRSLAPARFEQITLKTSCECALARDAGGRYNTRRRNSSFRGDLDRDAAVVPPIPCDSF